MKRTRWALFCGLFLWAASSAATPKALPFTYGAETTPKGQGEVEQYVDLVPLRLADGKHLGSQFQTELEYGLASRVELGFYVVFAPPPQIVEHNGAKQRVRWRLGDPGDWPIDVALYFEVAEVETEIELEAKLILERRFGDLRLVANAWVEHEFHFDGTTEWVLNPTGGFTYQVTPSFFVGAEYWMRYDTGGDWNAGPHHYVGPTLKMAFGNFFWTAGYYARMNDFGRVLQPGDIFGATWFRSVAGFSF